MTAAFDSSLYLLVLMLISAKCVESGNITVEEKIRNDPDLSEVRFRFKEIWRFLHYFTVNQWMKSTQQRSTNSSKHFKVMVMLLASNRHV